MNDLKPFRHGEEGTHFCCKTRIKNEGDKAKCCECVPHSDCDYDIKRSKKINVKINKGRNLLE